MNLVGNSNNILENPLGDYQDMVKAARNINDADREYRLATEKGATKEAHDHRKLEEDLKFLSQHPRF